MDILDTFFKKYAYRFDKGYPDMDNKEDVLLLESLLSEVLGSDFKIEEEVLEEEVKLEYDALSIKGKEVAKQLINLLGVSQEQIKPASATKIVIYDEDRTSLFDKIEQSAEYGTANQVRTGNWKKDGITIVLKPTGATSGEFFNLKPQNLGITLDKQISLTQLKQEIIQGIESNTVLSELHKKALLYTVTATNPPTPKEVELLLADTGFFKEVNKNFGESHGALIFGMKQGDDSVEFPEKGNYRLIDYILYNKKGRTQISAKADRTLGNTVKYEDVVKLVRKAGGEISSKIKDFTDIISNNSVITGAFEAIEKFGDENLKQKVKEYKVTYPEYPKIGNKPQDKQAHFDRITIEKEFVKLINKDPELDFNKLFNEYVEIKYVKYQVEPKTLKAVIHIISSGSFTVSHRTKNSSGHDSDKIGLNITG